MRRGRVVPHSGEGRVLESGGKKPTKNKPYANELPLPRKKVYKTVKEDFGKASKGNPGY